MTPANAKDNIVPVNKTRGSGHLLPTAADTLIGGVRAHVHMREMTYGEARPRQHAMLFFFRGGSLGWARLPINRGRSPSITAVISCPCTARHARELFIAGWTLLFFRTLSFGKFDSTPFHLLLLFRFMHAFLRRVRLGLVTYSWYELVEWYRQFVMNRQDYF